MSYHKKIRSWNTRCTPNDLLNEIKYFMFRGIKKWKKIKKKWLAYFAAGRKQDWAHQVSPDRRPHVRSKLCQLRDGVLPDQRRQIPGRREHCRAAATSSGRPRDVLVVVERRAPPQQRRSSSRRRRAQLVRGLVVGLVFATAALESVASAT